MSSAEAARQQALLHSLMRRDHGHSLPGAGLRQRGERLRRGMQAYEAHAGAVAESALQARYPTVHALVGADSFAALARAFWQAQPPQRGDLAQFGQGLPEFLTADAQLADVPYLTDAARLDQQLAAAENAADPSPEPQTLAHLGELAPENLWLELAPGTALLRSPHPIVSLWAAHQGLDAAGVEDEVASTARFAAFRAASAQGTGECALVWREGWRARVEAVDVPTADWLDALLQRRPLSDALARAGEAFAFEPWLIQALQRGLLMRVGQVGAPG